jgi:hypothetical protein
MVFSSLHLFLLPTSTSTPHPELTHNERRFIMVKKARKWHLQVGEVIQLPLSEELAKNSLFKSFSAVVVERGEMGGEEAYKLQGVSSGKEYPALKYSDIPTVDDDFTPEDDLED